MTTKATFRVCNKCDKPGTVDDFYAHGAYIDRQCKTCYGKKAAAWDKTNANRKREIRRESAKKRYQERPDLHKNRRLKTTYGITLDDYNRMLSAQSGVCAICKNPETATWRGKPKPLAVDHDHTTKKIRGLLCANCNQGLGLGRDGVELFQEMIDYLDTARQLPSRPRPASRGKLEWLGEAERPQTDKECQLHCYRYKEYGITMSEFNALRVSQGDQCAICDAPETAIDHRSGQIRNLSVDHDHKTGTIRGLLCWRCNAILGRVSDDVIILRSMIGYLAGAFGHGSVILVTNPSAGGR